MHRVGSAGLMVHEGQAVLGVPLDEPNPIGPSDEHDGPADSVHRVEEDRQSAAQTRQRQRDTLLRLQQSCAEVAEEVERKKRKLAEALRDQRNLKLRMRELDGHAPSRGGGGGDGSSVDAEPALPLPHGAAELSGLDAGALFADAAMSEIFSEEVSASIAAGTDSAVEAAEWDERCGLLTDEHEEWCEDAKFFTVPNICPFVKKCYEIVNSKRTDPVVSWAADGLSFVVHDPQRCALEILPRFFKHSNLMSWVRQLNKYGFRRVVRERAAGVSGGGGGSASVGTSGAGAFGPSAVIAVAVAGGAAGGLGAHGGGGGSGGGCGGGGGGGLSSALACSAPTGLVMSTLVAGAASAALARGESAALHFRHAAFQRGNLNSLPSIRVQKGSAGLGAADGLNGSAAAADSQPADALYGGGGGGYGGGRAGQEAGSGGGSRDGAAGSSAQHGGGGGKRKAQTAAPLPPLSRGAEDGGVARGSPLPSGGAHSQLQQPRQPLEAAAAATAAPPSVAVAQAHYSTAHSEGYSEPRSPPRAHADPRGDHGGDDGGGGAPSAPAAAFADTGGFTVGNETASAALAQALLVHALSATAGGHGRPMLDSLALQASGGHLQFTFVKGPPPAMPPPGCGIVPASFMQAVQQHAAVAAAAAAFRPPPTPPPKPAGAAQPPQQPPPPSAADGSALLCLRAVPLRAAPASSPSPSPSSGVAPKADESAATANTLAAAAAAAATQSRGSSAAGATAAAAAVAAVSLVISSPAATASAVVEAAAAAANAAAANGGGGVDGESEPHDSVQAQAQGQAQLVLAQQALAASADGTLPAATVLSEAAAANLAAAAAAQAEASARAVAATAAALVAGGSLPNLVLSADGSFASLLPGSPTARAPSLDERATFATADVAGGVVQTTTAAVLGSAEQAGHDAAAAAAELDAAMMLCEEADMISERVLPPSTDAAATDAAADDADAPMAEMRADTGDAA